LDVVGRTVEAEINRLFSVSPLSALDVKIRFIPIVMPEGMREHFRPRSDLKKKRRIYDCTPYLDYDTFAQGTFDEQLREYMRGLTEAVPYLAGLGATSEQIGCFKGILAATEERILRERPDQTRQ
jgi:hypothetical protein